MSRYLFIILFLLGYNLGCILGVGYNSGVGALYAQTLTLDSCLTLALQNNKNLYSAKLEVEKAKEVRNQARTKYFPQISLQGGGYHALNPLLEIKTEDVPNETLRNVLDFIYENFGETLGLPNSISFMRYGIAAQVTAIQPVYMGGKIVVGNKLAKVGVEAAELQAQIEERNLLLEVEEAYWLVVNLKEKQRTVEAAKALLDTLYKQVSVAVNAGLAMPNDLMAVRLRQDEMNAKSIQLSNGTYLATCALCQTLGISYSPTIEFSNEQITHEPQYAIQPERKLLSLNVKAEELKKRMSLADALPQVIIGGSYGYTNILSPFNQNGHQAFVETNQARHLNGLLGVSINIPLTAWWETSHKLREHNIFIKQAVLKQADLNEKLDLKKIQTYNAMIEAQTLCQSYSNSVELAEENYRVCNANYKAGLLSISELLQAQTLLFQAQNNLSDAQSSLQIATHKYNTVNY